MAPQGNGSLRCAWQTLLSAAVLVDLSSARRTESSSQLHSLTPLLQSNLAEIIALTTRLPMLSLSKQHQCLVSLVKHADAEFTRVAPQDALDCMWSTDDGISEEEMMSLLRDVLDNVEKHSAKEGALRLGAKACQEVELEQIQEVFRRIVFAIARSTMRSSTAKFQGLQSSTDQFLQAMFPENFAGWGLCGLIVCAILGFTSTCYGLWNCKLTRQNRRFRSPIDKGLLVKGKQLGEGGFGSVFLCQVKGSKDRRVVKMIQVDMDDMNAVQEALEEAKKLISLRHINIVQYIDIFLHRQMIGELTVSDYVCIVMEHCEGGCLRDLMEEEGFKPLTPYQILDAFHQVCLGLESTHKMGIIHTDIKLENIMVSFRGKTMILKIGDYGLAVHIGTGENENKTVPGWLRVASQPHLNSVSKQSFKKQSGKKQSRKKHSTKLHSITKGGHVTEAIGGTPAYISPEIFETFDHFSEDPIKVEQYDSVMEGNGKSNVVAFPVDIWALAFVLFELSGLEIADEEPFPGQQALEKDNWDETRDGLCYEFLDAMTKKTVDADNTISSSTPTIDLKDDSVIESDVNIEDKEDDNIEDEKEAKEDTKKIRISDTVKLEQLKTELKDSLAGTQDWIALELIKIFHSMLERLPSKRMTIQEILASKVFLLLPNRTNDNAILSRGDELEDEDKNMDVKSILRLRRGVSAQ